MTQHSHFTRHFRIESSSSGIASVMSCLLKKVSNFNIYLPVIVAHSPHNKANTNVHCSQTVLNWDSPSKRHENSLVKDCTKDKNLLNSYTFTLIYNRTQDQRCILKGIINFHNHFLLWKFHVSINIFTILSTATSCPIRRSPVFFSD